MEYPAGVEWMTDLSAATWIEGRLAEWKDPLPIPVGTILPEGFEAYARVFHPLRPDGAYPFRWSAFAAERGKVAHPGMQFESLIETVDRQSATWQPLAPEWGSLPEEECGAMVESLRSFTETPDVCWFALWDGYGFGFWPDDREYAKRPTRRDRRVILTTASAEREAARQAELERIPTFGTLRHRLPNGRLGEPGRTYYLFRGPIDAALGFHFLISWQSPNLWWPDDRAWCVGTEVDGFCSFVGGSAGAIAAVVGSPRLEAMPLEGDLRFNVGIDEVNGRPPDWPG